MNRHDRRAQRAKERKARRTGDVVTGRYLTLNDVPEHIRNNPNFQKGLKGSLPPEYGEQIVKAAILIMQWRKEHPTADLQWVKQKDDGTFVSAALCDIPSWIADSSDAYALLEWVDEKTGRQLSFNMFVWALRMCRDIPMPDGTYWEVEVTKKSLGLQALEDFAFNRGATTQIPPSPCGHCGVILENASAAKGVVPKPGDVSVCVKCYEFNRFNSEMRNVVLTADEFNALNAEEQAALLDMQSLMRGYRTKIAFGTKGRTDIEA